MFSASNVANFLACQHIATLDRAEARGDIKRPFLKKPTLDLLRTLGLRHEQRYLSEITAKNGRTIAHIDVTAGWEHACAETLKALQDGTEVIYQATFLNGNWGGRSEFLVRVDKPSALGPWSYEPIETKLARSTKATALVQLCFYSDLLAQIQKMEPEWMHVVLGGATSPESYRVQRYLAYFRHVRAEFEKAWKWEPQTYPEITEHCDVCGWFTLCDERRRSDDHLCLVAGISRNQRKALVERGTTTVFALSQLSLPPIPKIENIGDAALVRIREQARLQVQGREQRKLLYELLDNTAADTGLAILPPPSLGDLFVDFESNPYVLEQGLEYLIGVVSLSGSDEPDYDALWAFNRTDERNCFETFIGKVMERWRQHPDMHIYHYAPYEPTAIKRLVGRHSTCVDEVDQLLRAGVFVDLYRAVRQGIRASVESYSIKRIEPLYGFTRSVPLQDANFALQSYEAAMALGNGTDEIAPLLKTIEGYNRDDCVSALHLRDWLEKLRNELELKSGKPLPRPSPRTGEPSETLSVRLQESRALAARIVGSLPADETSWTEEHRACWLLAQMFEYHRREEKATWWEFFRLCSLSEDELQQDKDALGGLTLMREVARIKRSVVYRYSFPPQDYTIELGTDVRDPKTGSSPGKVEGVDERGRTIDLKRSVSSSAPHPTALVPLERVDPAVLHDSILRTGYWVADHRVAGPGELEAARQLLLRQRPCALPGVESSLVGKNEELTEPAKTLVRSLAHEPSVLPVQGPPGSGKTFTGARMIIELVRQGRRVGITAVSHRAISTMLREVCSAATHAGVSLKAVQKASGDDGCDDDQVTQTKDSQVVLESLTSGSANVAAGSAWLWAREAMIRSVDVLFVDEAGQMSLANVLAVCPAATSIVLLGDPQQLEQPQQGIHPPGAEASALGHLLNGRPTIAPDQGIFLPETRRLHPDICAFASELFYEGRLVARPENSMQRLNSPEPLGGTGLRFVPVEHSGNQNESAEEVERVAALVNRLLKSGASWTNKHAQTKPITLRDILIVAPYNAQVSALAERLPAGAHVGTVDKFQGQEAPVVLYSLATSTPEDAQRGMEFLYSGHRLNVAISRARCVAIIVASPALFDVQCKSPSQMELANAFCRFVEMAQSLP